MRTSGPPDGFIVGMAVRVLPIVCGMDAEVDCVTGGASPFHLDFDTEHSLLRARYRARPPKNWECDMNGEVVESNINVPRTEGVLVG